MPQDSEMEASLHLFRVLVRAWRAVSGHSLRSSKSLGLHPTEFAVMELLFRKGPQALGSIGSRLLMVSGGVTYVADKLEKKGWIRRSLCPKDRRVVYLSLTEEGSRLMEEMFPKHAARVHEAMQGLTASEKEELIRLLKKMGLAAEEKLARDKRG